MDKVLHVHQEYFPFLSVCSSHSPMLVSDVDGLPWFDVDTVIVARTLIHGHTDTFIIQVETLRAGAAIHRLKVQGAALSL